MKLSPETAKEIARLMRDPNALRRERERMPPSGRRGHYDPNQPRVHAGQSGGGQWADTGRSAGELAQAQQQAELSLKELVRICALNPARVAADFGNSLMPWVGRVDPITGERRTLDWVRQQAYEMEENIRKNSATTLPPSLSWGDNAI